MKMFQLLVVLAVVAGTSLAQADDKEKFVPKAKYNYSTHHCEGECCGVDYECLIFADTDKATKECFLVECKPICIPPVTFPWQKKSCCEPVKGKVKFVRVPVLYEYEECECVFEHEFVAKPKCGTGCCEPSCAAPAGCCK